MTRWLSLPNNTVVHVSRCFIHSQQAAVRMLLASPRTTTKLRLYTLLPVLALSTQQNTASEFEMH